MSTASIGGIRRAKRALIVHRHLLFADALTRTLERMWLVTTTVTDPEVAVDAVLARSPHVALIEVGHRGRGGHGAGGRAVVAAGRGGGRRAGARGGAVMPFLSGGFGAYAPALQAIVSSPSWASWPTAWRTGLAA